MRVGDAERSNHRDTLIGNPTKDLCGIVTHASHITRHASHMILPGRGGYVAQTSKEVKPVEEMNAPE
jgi:hypothetical protein